MLFSKVLFTEFWPIGSCFLWFAWFWKGFRSLTFQSYFTFGFVWTK